MTHPRRIYRLALTIAAAFLCASLLAACPGSEAELKPGHCYMNSDCPQGYNCEEGRCQDIYFPRKAIKPF